MVRVFLKGGVWKNSEDEILKAAVQKYGLQNWARVASLLNRKSAKQCKARWFEWLDPSVRKVEWSREEEEKLLHLAKLMPAQWKTIGPLVGRTATQCQEHYEKLLDEAASAAARKEGGEDGGEGGTDLRHQPLRVGQIDSHPETKPARPDPIDMDEDEIEMLQEARARLANTQGKKAKRKAREKMLAQAKRLAELQKRRELKQAGLLSSQAKKRASKRNRDIDLGVEIPFHKPAPAGFHDVSNEVARSETLRAKQLKQVDFHKLNEQQYRSRDAEAQRAKKREEARMRALERSNMQYVVAQVSKINDPLNIRKRGPLELPPPSVTDQELQSMAKLESAAAAIPALAAAASGSGATSALLADYSDRPLPTPMRTPMTTYGSAVETKQQSIMKEASNLRMLERGQTPLLGGDDPISEGLPDNDDGESKPPARPTTPGGPVSKTRDHFGLNRPQSELRGSVDDNASVGASTFATATTVGGMTIRELARAERRAAKQARKELEEALATLPAPQFEYELEAPMDIDDDDNEAKVQTVVEEDMAHVEAEERRRLRLEAEKLYEARSSVVKRNDLPRPVGAISDLLASRGDMDRFETLIDEERLTLLKHDAYSFPVEAPPSLLENGGFKKKKKRKQVANENASSLLPETILDVIPEESLDMAKEMIRTECEQLVLEKAQPIIANGKSLEEATELIMEETTKATKGSAAVDEVFVRGSWIDPKGNSKLLAESYAQEFDILQQVVLALHKNNEKAESKLALLTGGLVKRAGNTIAEIAQLYQGVQNSSIEETVYQKLRQHEDRGGVARIEQLRNGIYRLQEDEVCLQAVYNQLVAQQAAPGR
ncbi:pre-mRNA splicing factor component [Nitzschia inconspicua]|uniref:Pre-mRNA splicing factor component n=1 Tax=Nitzschia inconspicua TaxID=303405 RepID=A0A9K3LK85_9STRA|nr:pre-mRNA splicing factor component [Nitzschia inconspicua]KAG7362551.1 pre-mRNA splicing factor component [Nitzschia inconspicua]